MEETLFRASPLGARKTAVAARYFRACGYDVSQGRGM